MGTHATPAVQRSRMLPGSQATKSTYQLLPFPPPPPCPVLPRSAMRFSKRWWGTTPTCNCSSALGGGRHLPIALSKLAGLSQPCNCLPYPTMWYQLFKHVTPSSTGMGPGPKTEGAVHGSCRRKSGCLQRAKLQAVYRSSAYDWTAKERQKVFYQKSKARVL